MLPKHLHLCQNVDAVRLCGAAHHPTIAGARTTCVMARNLVDCQPSTGDDAGSFTGWSKRSHRVWNRENSDHACCICICLKTRVSGAHNSPSRLEAPAWHVHPFARGAMCSPTLQPGKQRLRSRPLCRMILRSLRETRDTLPSRRYHHTPVRHLTSSLTCTCSPPSL